MIKSIVLNSADVRSLREVLEYVCESEVEDFEEQLKERDISYHDDYSTREEFQTLFCGGNKPKWHVFQQAMSLLLELNQEDNT